MTKQHLQEVFDQNQNHLGYAKVTSVSGVIPDEMFDFIEVLEMGAKKYAWNNWLNTDGKKCSEKDMHDSMFHHLSESYAFGKAHTITPHIYKAPKDHESGLDPLLHLACRALMLYTRRQRGITHEDDISS